MTPEQYTRTEREIAALPPRIRRAIKAAGAIDAVVQAQGTDELRDALTPLLHELLESVDAFDTTKLPPEQKYVHKTNEFNLAVYVIDWLTPEVELPHSSISQPPRLYLSLQSLADVTGLAPSTILRKTAGAGHWHTLRKPVTDIEVAPAFAYTGRVRLKRFSYTDESIEELTELGFGDRLDEIINVWNMRSPLWIKTPYLEYMREQKEQTST